MSAFGFDWEFVSYLKNALCVVILVESNLYLLGFF